VNRGVRRQQLFWKTGDYAAFLAILAEGQQRSSVRILAFCVMPNHFHLVRWPRNGPEVVDFSGGAS
jgi:putative transposase